jgi:hypothetical protein
MFTFTPRAYIENMITTAIGVPLWGLANLMGLPLLWGSPL